jgi:hypothetical protein
MAVRETLELDLRRALSQVQTLERGIDELSKPVSIPISVTGTVESDIRSIDDRLEEIESEVSGINSELAVMEGATGQIVTDFSRLATELNISEQEASDLALGILDARNSANRVEEAAREVARQLGLSEDEAKAFAGEVGKAAGRMDDLDGSTRRAEGGVERLRGGFARLATAALAFVGIREIGRFVSQSITAFSNLEESTSKANVVFGAFADEVFEFVDDAPGKLGSTTAAALEMASSFGNLFLSIGLSQEEAAEFSTTMVQLGTDIASFNNISVDEALEKLRSGLVGQAEPLRTVGVLLSEAAVQAKAYELGLGDATGQLTEAEKVQARYAIILEQTVTAQGDFARTSEGIANSSRTAVALFGELKTTVGEALAPAFAELVSLAPEIVAGFENMVPAIRAAADALVEFFRPKEGQADLLDILNFLLDLPRGFGQVADVVSGTGSGLVNLNAAVAELSTGDIGGFVDALTDMDVALDNIARNTVERTGLQFLIQEIREGVDPALAFSNAIALIGRRGTIDQQTVENFLAIANVDTRQARLELQRLIDEAPRLRLSAQEVGVLEDALFDLNAEFFEGDRANRDYLENIRRLGEVAETTAGPVRDQAEVLTLLRSEADLLGISLSELLLGGAEKFPELAGLIGELEPATRDLALAEGNLSTFADTFETTNVRISGAIDEFGKLPEKLKVSRDEFLANLTISAAEEAKFQADLLALFNIAPALATRLQQQGPATRDLVVEFLDDTTSAERAESIITGNAEDIVGTFTDSVATSIEQSDLDVAGIEALIKFLEGFGNTAVTEAAVAALEALLQQEISDMRFRISGGQFSFEEGFSLVPGSGPFTGTIGSGVTLIQNTTINNPTTTDLPTNVAQLEQAQSGVGSIINQIGPF